MLGAGAWVWSPGHPRTEGLFLAGFYRTPRGRASGNFLKIDKTKQTNTTLKLLHYLQQNVRQVKAYSRWGKRHTRFGGGRKKIHVNICRDCVILHRDERLPFFFKCLIISSNQEMTFRGTEGSSSKPRSGVGGGVTPTQMLLCYEE